MPRTMRPATMLVTASALVSIAAAFLPWFRVPSLDLDPGQGEADAAVAVLRALAFGGEGAALLGVQGGATLPVALLLLGIGALWYPWASRPSRPGAPTAAGFAAAALAFVGAGLVVLAPGVAIARASIGLDTAYGWYLAVCAAFLAAALSARCLRREVAETPLPQDERAAAAARAVVPYQALLWGTLLALGATVAVFLPWAYDPKKRVLLPGTNAEGLAALLLLFWGALCLGFALGRPARARPATQLSSVILARLLLVAGTSCVLLVGMERMLAGGPLRRLHPQVAFGWWVAAASAVGATLLVVIACWRLRAQGRNGAAESPRAEMDVEAAGGEA